MVATTIFWQNTDGQASIWDLSGTSISGGGPVSPSPGPTWSLIGATGDFIPRATSLSEILWQNANGQISIWEMDGNNLAGGGAVEIAGGTTSLNPGPSWKAIGTGDFNDDDHPDVLLQNTSTGQVSVWEMNGNDLIGGGAVDIEIPGEKAMSVSPGPSWKAIGTGDFNDDHHSDILFQNTSTGQVSIWEMSGNHLMGGGAVTIAGGTTSLNPGLSWKAIGTGDFNADSHSDILFQNTSTGQISIWEMNGTNLIGGELVSADPGPSWHAIGTDGGSDILFQNTSGQASIWEMHGTTIAGGGPISPNPGPSWHAVGIGTGSSGFDIGTNPKV
jgi:hypothetical protein